MIYPIVVLKSVPWGVSVLVKSVTGNIRRRRKKQALISRIDTKVKSERQKARFTAKAQRTQREKLFFDRIYMIIIFLLIRVLSVFVSG